MTQRDRTGSNQFAVPTLETLMGLYDNDWTPESEKFKRITGRELDALEPLDEHAVWNFLRAWDIRRQVSLVIPTQLDKRSEHLQLTLRALQFQTFLKARPRRSSLEIVIVNDGAVSPERAFEVARYKPKNARMVIVSVRGHNGPAVTRNVGLHFSRGEVVFFMDSDMLLERTLIAEHIIRHEYIPTLALLTFRWDIEVDEARRVLVDAEESRELALPVDWTKDWKARPYAVDGACRLNGKSLKAGETVQLFDLTHGFRSWTGTVNRRNLASVFATSCVSVRREHLLAVGGFRSHYRGWGIEDRDLGSRLLARGVRLVPVRSACARHVRHPEDHSTKSIDEEANLARYNSLIKEPYRENPANLLKQMEDLKAAKDIFPPLEFEGGVPIPRRSATIRMTSEDHPIEQLLRLADTQVRRIMSRPGQKVTAGDLKWNVMIEETPGGALAVNFWLWMSNRPDAHLRLGHSEGWAGHVVAETNRRLIEGRGASIREIGRARVVNFVRGSKERVKVAMRGLSHLQKEQTAYVKVLATAPIIVRLDWFEREYYCIGAVNMQAGLDLDLPEDDGDGDRLLDGSLSPGHPALEALSDVASVCGDMILAARAPQSGSSGI